MAQNVERVDRDRRYMRHSLLLPKPCCHFSKQENWDFWKGPTKKWSQKSRHFETNYAVTHFQRSHVIKVAFASRLFCDQQQENCLSFSLVCVCFNDRLPSCWLMKKERNSPFVAICSFPTLTHPSSLRQKLVPGQKNIQNSPFFCFSLFYGREKTEPTPPDSLSALSRARHVLLWPEF